MMTESMMTDTYTIRLAEPHDEQAILELLPLLADFDLPEGRDASDLWTSDAKLLQQVIAGTMQSSFARVAIDAQHQVCGVTLVSLRSELMSHTPSAHLEAIVVHPDARGTGLAKILLDDTEKQAKERGAKSLSLHVFANNYRARKIYDREGFDSELIRAIKWFD